jgi:hypothetical protein
MARSREKWGFWLWIFAEECEISGVYWSVIGHRLRVGAKGEKGKAQEWCKWVWIGVEMWKGGREDGDVFMFDWSTAIGCPIFATVLSSIRWAIVRSAIRLSSSEPQYLDWAGFVKKIVTETRP